MQSDSEQILHDELETAAVLSQPMATWRTGGLLFIMETNRGRTGTKPGPITPPAWEVRTTGGIRAVGNGVAAVFPWVQRKQA